MIWKEVGENANTKNTQDASAVLLLGWLYSPTQKQNKNTHAGCGGGGSLFSRLLEGAMEQVRQAESAFSLNNNSGSVPGDGGGRTVHQRGAGGAEARADQPAGLPGRPLRAGRSVVAALPAVPVPSPGARVLADPTVQPARGVVHPQPAY